MERCYVQTPDRPLTLRLKRVEGQIRGLQRMLAEESSCEQLLTQLLAARSALDQIGLLILSQYVDECLISGDEQEIRNNVRKLLNLLLSRYSTAVQYEGEPEPAANESQTDDDTIIPIEL